MGLRRSELALSSVVGPRRFLVGVTTPAVLLFDSFTDPDGTALTSHRMDTGPGWTAGAGAAQVNSNKANFTADAASYVLTTGQSDGTVSLAVTIASTAAVAAILFRCTDTNNCWYLRLGGSADVVPGLSLYKVNGGSATQVYYSVGTPGAGSYALSVTFRGSTINGSGGGLTVSGTDAFNSTVKTHGFYSQQSANTFDNFLMVP